MLLTYLHFHLSRVWNIRTSYLHESEAYPCVTPRNIPQVLQRISIEFNQLSRFWGWTENPRVGGSIPPLATINSLNINNILIEQFQEVLVH